MEELRGRRFRNNEEGEAEHLMIHLDQIDLTGPIKFTFEGENDGSIAYHSSIQQSLENQTALWNYPSIEEQPTPDSNPIIIYI